MARLAKRVFLILLVLTPALQADSLDLTAATVSPHDYTAVYQVFRNDKELGGVTISLSHQGEVWTLHGYTHDMHGLAKMLKIKGSQTSTGKWKDGRFLPDDYKLAFSLIGYRTGWSAVFDWSDGIVTTTSKDGETKLSLADGAVDPFSLSLNFGSLLANNRLHMTLDVIDKDMIDSEVYAAEADESFDSALGCLQTTRVKRIRENSKRISMVWYANDHDYIPVLIHHSKKKGNKMELQITSLDLDGQRIQPTNHCNGNHPGS
ncbi:MAG: DUF3108 domain-containing protein [Xanthomonadales bacterium]|nr:DUF3108 domain-containing protein [Xanthomonadales bacterium]